MAVLPKNTQMGPVRKVPPSPIGNNLEKKHMSVKPYRPCCLIKFFPYSVVFKRLLQSLFKKVLYVGAESL